MDLERRSIAVEGPRYLFPICAAAQDDRVSTTTKSKTFLAIDIISSLP
jgi:hypothetical protein